MKILRHLKIRSKLMLIIAGSSMALVCLGLVGLLYLRTMSGGFTEEFTAVGEVNGTQDLRAAFLGIRLDLASLLALEDRSAFDSKLEDLRKKEGLIREITAHMGKGDLEPSERDSLAAFAKGFEAYAAQAEKLIPLAGEGIGSAARHGEAATFATAGVEPLYDAPEAALLKMNSANIVSAKEVYNDNMQNYRHAVVVLVGLLIFFIVCGTGAGMVIAVTINSSLREVTSRVHDIAEGEGDLTKRIEILGKDEIGELSGWLNVFIEKLYRIVSQVAHNTAEVAAGAEQVCGTAEQMAAGSDRLAAQTAAVSTASEEMSGTSGEIAGSCGLAAQGAKHANDSALSGTAVVRRTVEAMGRLAEQVKNASRSVEGLGARSDQIGDIVQTIENIADQTNLLALNAAIEAARAGDQGRGFAVVADEVRALAERTTRATHEIGEMIKSIQQETATAVRVMEAGVGEAEQGTQEATRSGEALEEIFREINEVNGQINQIAVAAEEQSSTVDSISSNLHEINEVVGETSRGAHETVAAASRMTQAASELQRLVGQFKLV